MSRPPLHRVRQLELRLAAGELWSDHDLVFCTGRGHALDGNNVCRSFAALLARASLPRVRFHDLRHSAASLLMSEGTMPVKVIAEMLGHSDVTTTLRVYSHVLPAMHDQAADAIDRLFQQR